MASATFDRKRRELKLFLPIEVVVRAEGNTAKLTRPTTVAVATGASEKENCVKDCDASGKVVQEVTLMEVTTASEATIAAMEAATKDVVPKLFADEIAATDTQTKVAASKETTPDARRNWTLHSPERHEATEGAVVLEAITDVQTRRAAAKGEAKEDTASGGPKDESLGEGEGATLNIAATPYEWRQNAEYIALIVQVFGVPEYGLSKVPKYTSSTPLDLC